MKTIIVSLLLCSIAWGCSAQNKTVALKSNPTKVDSTLMNYVKGIQLLIEQKMKTEISSRTMWGLPRSIMIGNEGPVSIDSLYKYNYKDFKKICIVFDDQMYIYGLQAPYGYLILEKKEK